MGGIHGLVGVEEVALSHPHLLGTVRTHSKEEDGFFFFEEAGLEDKEEASLRILGDRCGCLVGVPATG